ncbi:histidinol-phosphate aminotransferase [Neisseria gonorrhoeae]|uniref:Histidinol-phosphate aminotransferase n=1 Tax=Neisseria gonorrhoeae TaxID=485 RepID=A0A378VUX6_NEIGO|nr:histidinol-phosphate aminotransferase [Neisseria gonorrhoeae]
MRSAFDIPDCAAVALGNGSDELIQFITMLTAKPGAAMLAAEPGSSCTATTPRCTAWIMSAFH